MKSTFFVVLCSLLTSIAFSQKKIALIVAISEYEAGTGWEKLNTERDVIEITAALGKQGFKKGDIKIIKNKEATKANILKGIDDFLLDKAGIRDQVYFHFSGHGQQMADYNKDEFDWLDEALVPVDAKSKYDPAPKGYKGEQHLSDDELMSSLNKVRKKLGPEGHVLMVIDACFSGGMLRGPGYRAVVRGANDKMAPDDWATSNQLLTTAGSEIAKSEGLELKDDQSLAPIVAFTASQSHQPNAEYNGGGSLSHVFSKVLMNMNSQMSYNGLYRLVREEMALIVPNQVPQADGNLNTYVFNASAALAKPFFKVKVGKENNKPTWILNGGSLHGLTLGSKVGFYANELVGTEEKPLFTTTLKHVNSVASFLEVLPDVKVENLWVYLLELAPAEDKIRTCIQVQSAALRDQLKSDIQKEALLKEVNDTTCACRIIQDSPQDSIDVITNNEHLIARLPAVSTSIPLLFETLKLYARAEFFRKVGAENSGSGNGGESVSVSFIPVRVEYGAIKGELPLSDFTDKNGVVSFPEGTMVRLRVTNNSGVKGYFSLLDIQPDNKINILMPSQGSSGDTPSDYLLTGQVGQTFELPRSKNSYYTIGEPYGNEVLKLIVTEEPLDLRPLLASRGGLRGSRGALSKMELLFADAMSATRSMTESVPVREVGFFQTTFEIRPRVKPKN